MKWLKRWNASEYDTQVHDGLRSDAAVGGGEGAVGRDVVLMYVDDPKDGSSDDAVVHQIG